MPFVGGNLLLSHLVHIKTVLQATSYEKTSAVSLRVFSLFPPWLLVGGPAEGGSMVEAAQGDSSPFWGGRLGFGGPGGASEGSQAERPPRYRQL